MSKNIYSEDIEWYDKGVYNAIMELAEKHNNAIPVFGGALGAYNRINCDEPDYKSFIAYLPTVAENAKFFEWHEGALGALRRFCHLCYIDPHLMEIYIGAPLHELC
jgi:hypothetical protein